MLLPPSTWQSKIVEVPPSSRLLPCSRCCQAKSSCGQVLGARKRHSEPGLWPWPPCSAQHCPCPRDTTGHKAGIDLQPSGYAGYLNATRNYASPILYTETSLPLLRSQKKRRVRISVGSTNLSRSLQRSAFFFPFVLNPLRAQTNKHPPSKCIKHVFS